VVIVDDSRTTKMNHNIYHLVDSKENVVKTSVSVEYLAKKMFA